MFPLPRCSVPQAPIRVGVDIYVGLGMDTAMSTLTYQRFIASVFFILGGWALVAPSSVIALCIRPEWHDGGRLAPFAIGCFGAQALIAGLFAAFSRFTPRTFLAYAIGLIPFFVFDLWFTFVDPVLTLLGGMLDGIGNIIMFVLCWLGYKQAAA